MTGLRTVMHMALCVFLISLGALCGPKVGVSLFLGVLIGLGAFLLYYALLFVALVFSDWLKGR